MAETDASTDLRRKLTVVDGDDGAALLPIAVDAFTGRGPSPAKAAADAPEFTLAQLERWQAAPFLRAA